MTLFNVLNVTIKVAVKREKKRSTIHRLKITNQHREKIYSTSSSILLLEKKLQVFKRQQKTQVLHGNKIRRLPQNSMPSSY